MTQPSESPVTLQGLFQQFPHRCWWEGEGTTLSHRGGGACREGGPRGRAPPLQTAAHLPWGVKGSFPLLFPEDGGLGLLTCSWDPWTWL